MSLTLVFVLLAFLVPFAFLAGALWAGCAKLARIADLEGEIHALNARAKENEQAYRPKQDLQRTSCAA